MASRHWDSDVTFVSPGSSSINRGEDLPCRAVGGAQRDVIGESVAQRLVGTELSKTHYHYILTAMPSRAFQMDPYTTGAK